VAADLFSDVLAWWHRVTVLRVRQDQSAEVLDFAGEDRVSSSGCLPVGALDGDDEFEAHDVFELDDHPPD
jgi:hypothetical protein